MSLDYKRDIIKKKNTCFVCLKRLHMTNQYKQNIDDAYAKIPTL